MSHGHHTQWHAVTAALWLALVPGAAGRAEQPEEPALHRMVEADWALQEARLKRGTDSPAAIREALRRGRRLRAALADRPKAADLAAPAPALAALETEARDLDTLGAAQRRSLYLRVRWAVRELALANPLLAGKPILFMKRRRFVCQMLHEYCGYWYDKIAGGGVFVLPQPGRSLAVRDLTRSRPAAGSYTTLALSYDAKTAYFAFVHRDGKACEYRRADWMSYATRAGRTARTVRAEGPPQTASAGRAEGPARRPWRCFHLYAMDIESGRVRELTDGPNDDFDPCPLPDGGLAFMSSRRGGYTRCNNEWEPLPAYTLHRLEPDGQTVRALSVHETNEWHPRVLNDGRIIYTRWDYVDRSAANFHGLWTTGPGGTNPEVLFGSYTRTINACFQPHPIPGSRKIAFLAGAHHADVGGSLLVLDPDRVRLDRHTGLDDLSAVEVITPWICFPEGVGWPGQYVHSPWPLADAATGRGAGVFFLVAYSHRPLPGMGGGTKEDTPTGLYYLDAFGNLELLYEDTGISCMYPIPLVPRPVPPRHPAHTTAGQAHGGHATGKGRPSSQVHASRQANAHSQGGADGHAGDGAANSGRGEGVFVLSDVTRSVLPLPPGRPVRSLRIYQVLPKTWTHTFNRPRLGHANAESARLLVGQVPVAPDGSAHFVAPAGKPLCFQAVDADGRAVQTMRSVTYLQPGEQRGCVGCHEPRSTTPAAGGRPLALRHAASRPAAGPDGTSPMCYTRLVQPVLDRHCLRCHDGRIDAANTKRPALTARPAGNFTESYVSLGPYVRWYEWGGRSIHANVTRPGACGADASRLTRILAAHARAKRIQLPPADLRALYLWMDANAPFYGVYEDAPRRAQQRGQPVALPAIQ